MTSLLSGIAERVKICLAEKISDDKTPSLSRLFVYPYMSEDALQHKKSKLPYLILTPEEVLNEDINTRSGKLDFYLKRNFTIQIVCDPQIKGKDKFDGAELEDLQDDLIIALHNFSYCDYLFCFEGAGAILTQENIAVDVFKFSATRKMKSLDYKYTTANFEPFSLQTKIEV
jgi:hypothetical protein